jgi:hypothetical protein
MGARPSSFKKGGGFLNNVDGEITGYEFTPDFPGGDGKRKGKSDFNPLYFVLTVQEDGAEEARTTTLFAGSADDFEISKDGLTLEPVDNGGIGAKSDLGRFMASLVEAGFDENNLPEDDEPINYEAIVGQRVTFVQVKDEDAMAKAAKKWRQSGGKFNDQGQKKGKDGKYYNLQYLTVSAVLGEADERPAKGKKTAALASKGKTGTKVTKGRANGKVEVDIDELAKETLLAILADNDDSIAKSKLPAKIAQKLGVKHPQREEVRKRIYSDDFLTTEDGWSYDQSSKQQTIAVA